MSFRILGIVTFLFVTGGLANPIQAQEPVHRDEFGLEESDAERVDEEKAAGEGGLFTHYQVGVFHRLATNVTNETKQSYLVTGDLSFLRKSRFESSFGGGVHFAFDDAGHRLGLKGLWRTPLKKGTWSYFQLAPGIYGITHPELGGRIGADKIDAIIATEAEVALSANPGCMMQIGAGLLLRGSSTGVLHPAELLDESYRRAGYYL